MVPVALVRWLAIGSASERGTDGRAARWTTASAPSNTRSSRPASRIDPSTSSTPSSAGQVGRGARWRGRRGPPRRPTSGSARQGPAQVGADEPGATGDHDLHRRPTAGSAEGLPGRRRLGPHGSLHRGRLQPLDGGPVQPVAGVEHVGGVLADQVVVEGVVVGDDDHRVGPLRARRRSVRRAGTARSWPAEWGSTTRTSAPSSVSDWAMIVPGASRASPVLRL